MKIFNIPAIYFFVALYIFFFNGKLGVKTFDTAWFYGLLICGIYWSGEQFFNYEKYKTPQLVSDNIHFSCCSLPRKVGLWSIYRGGDVEFLGIKGKDATIVAPTCLSFPLGENSVLTCRVEKVSFYNLPPEVRNVIETEGFSVEECYLGYVPLRFELENPSTVFSMIIDRDNNSLLASKDDIIKGKYTQIEDHVGHAGRITDRLKRGVISSWLDKIKPPAEQEVKT